MIRELFFNFYEKNNIEESFDNISKNNYALYDYLLILKKNIQPSISMKKLKL
jgi:hypothetical protein